MIFEGDLNRFYITEVLWCLIRFCKTGVLNCESDEEMISFYISNGGFDRIVNPYDDLKIGSILIKKGYINQKELGRALKQQKELSKPIGQILIQLNLLTREHLGKILESQIQEIIFRVAEWRDATFTFEDYPESESATTAIFSTKDWRLHKFIEELDQKVKIFKGLLKNMPPDDKILVLASKYSDKHDQIARKEEIRQIIDLADGERDIKAMRRESLLGTYRSQVIISKLVEAELLVEKKNSND